MLKLFLFLIFAIYAILGVNFFVEYNRLILLTVIYPSILLFGLGFMAWCEK